MVYWAIIGYLQITRTGKTTVYHEKSYQIPFTLFFSELGMDGGFSIDPNIEPKKSAIAKLSLFVLICDNY